MAATTHDAGVLLIYTGGTIGTVRADPRDPLSPLIPGGLDQILASLPGYLPRDKRIISGGRAVRLEAVSLEKPLDSADLGTRDWRELARLIGAHYDDYEGFVILHGTDTLAYTSSCLAFMLENLAKPVVITGSQRPIGETRSDAVQNLVTAIEFAAARTLGHPVIPEVGVLFHHQLFRGCRVRKVNADGYEGFASPNLPPLGRAGGRIEVNRALVRRPPGKSARFAVSMASETDLLVLELFPGIKPAVLRTLFDTPGLKGVVLKTFGAGNAPTDPEFLAAIKYGVREKGLLMVNVTQCLQGEVAQGRYRTSAGLLAAGVVGGLDLTPEAALTKMGLVLGQGFEGRDAADRMQLDLRGEQRASLYNIHFRPVAAETDRPITLRGEDGPLVLERDGDLFQGNAPYKEKHLVQAFLRLLDIETSDGRRGRLDFKVYLNQPDAGEATAEEPPTYLGRVSRPLTGGRDNVILEITRQAEQLIDTGHSPTLTLVPLGGSDLAIQNAHIALMTQD
ncbi:MAG: asparaginase [Candidatus Thiosymbion ectosymbiont of Robbea hypermnestra]|nr:asparaginase [Candidatus Thiosymbion ectosymbiont of Robbea hypermnestra]